MAVRILLQCVTLNRHHFLHFQGLGKVAHNIPMLTKDVQLSVNSSAMLIFVTGQLKIADGNPLLFSHVFQLVATGPGQYYVHNEIFRLIYA
jgi:hypothetical protein